MLTTLALSLAAIPVCEPPDDICPGNPFCDYPYEEPQWAWPPRAASCPPNDYIDVAAYSACYSLYTDAEAAAAAVATAAWAASEFQFYNGVSGVYSIEGTYDACRAAAADLAGRWACHDAAIDELRGTWMAAKNEADAIITTFNAGAAPAWQDAYACMFVHPGICIDFHEIEGCEYDIPQAPWLTLHDLLATPLCDSTGELPEDMDCVDEVWGPYEDARDAKKRELEMAYVPFVSAYQLEVGSAIFDYGFDNDCQALQNRINAAHAVVEQKRDELQAEWQTFIWELAQAMRQEIIDKCCEI